MTKFFSQLLSFSLLFLFVAGLAYAGEKEKISVTVVGQGSLEGSTIEKAEKNALKNAFQLAIEQGLGTFIRSETEVANFDLVKDKIISKSEGYILGYKKLRQWDDGKILNVKIKAVVSLKQLGNDFRAMLKAVTRQIDNPVIAFVLTAWEVPEATGQKKHLEGQILIDSFQEQFKNKGFDIKAADAAREFANTGTGKLVQMASGGRQAIAKYARDANANFVARGEITATFGGTDYATGAYKWTGTISVEMIDAATGELVASYSKTVMKKFPNKTQGLSALMHSGAENASRALAKQTLETWQQYAGSGRMYNIFVSGYKSYKQKRVIKKALDKFVEIRGQTEDRKKKILSFDVIFKGSAIELEDQSVEAMEEKGLEVQDLIIEGNKVTIKL